LPEKVFVTIEERKDAQPLSACGHHFKTESAVVDLLLKLSEALLLLWNHDRKLVHRDLKPDNLLITDQLDVIVIDLGIVRESGAAGITATHAPHGPLSPLYASPEQVKNDKRNISFKSDFFALGTIAYELLSGQHPFVRVDPPQYHDLMDSVPNYTPPRLDAVCQCSQQFATLIEMMMQKEPYRRFRSPEALQRALLALKGSF